jgi:hypothetical protein
VAAASTAPMIIDPFIVDSNRSMSAEEANQPDSSDLL